MILYRIIEILDSIFLILDMILVILVILVAPIRGWRDSLRFLTAARRLRGELANEQRCLEGVVTA